VTQELSESDPGITAEKPVDTIIGRTFAGVQIDRKVGQGGMGAVYRGVQLNLSRTVAVKILREKLTDNMQHVSRFLKEAKAVAVLSHPNIVHVYDAGVVDGLYYIIMEFVEGETAAHRLSEKGKIPVDEALDILEQVADALIASAEHGIIHRDIKPENIILSKSGKAMVTDFGLVKHTQETTSITRTGEIMGTPLFMSPEQCGGKTVDHRTDIYSLGASFYTMVTGRPPFKADTPLAVMLKHIHEDPPPAKELIPDLDDAVCALIEKMMHKNPEDRHADADELVEDIQRVKAGKAPTDLFEKGSEARPRRLLKRLAFWVVALAVVFVVLHAIREKRDTASDLKTAGNVGRPFQAVNNRDYSAARDMLVTAREALKKGDAMAANDLVGKAWTMVDQLAPAGLEKELKSLGETAQGLIMVAAAKVNKARTIAETEPEKAIETVEPILKSMPRFPGAAEVIAAAKRVIAEREMAEKIIAQKRLFLEEYMERAMERAKMAFGKGDFDAVRGTIDKIKSVEDDPPEIAGMKKRFIKKLKRMLKLKGMDAVPAAAFRPGSEKGAPDEKPGRELSMKAFHIEVHEVTNKEYRAFMDAGGYADKAYWSDEGWKWKEASETERPAFWDNKRFNAPRQPVVGVSFYEAEAYAKWAGKRLPTEAEWELACRGGDGRVYPWGNEFSKEAANTRESRLRATEPVGSRPSGKSPFGAHDMAGNAAEWCASAYSADSYAREDEPQPDNGGRRVVRGGSFFEPADMARACSRFSAPPSARERFISFRCVMDSETDE
jgi:serine/threonine-protein kinase